MSGRKNRTKKPIINSRRPPRGRVANWAGTLLSFHTPAPLSGPPRRHPGGRRIPSRLSLFDSLRSRAMSIILTALVFQLPSHRLSAKRPKIRALSATHQRKAERRILDSGENRSLVSSFSSPSPNQRPFDVRRMLRCDPFLNQSRFQLRALASPAQRGRYVCPASPGMFRNDR